MIYILCLVVTSMYCFKVILMKHNQTIVLICTIAKVESVATCNFLFFSNFYKYGLVTNRHPRGTKISQFFKNLSKKSFESTVKSNFLKCNCFKFVFTNISQTYHIVLGES